MQRLAPILFLVCISCGGKKEDKSSEEPKPVVKEAKPAPTPTPTPTPAPVEKPAPAGSNAGPNTPMVGEAPEGNPPPDGKYEKVVVEGVTVPMVQVMEGGTVVLVDTDGKKPRTWEEQYKKKKATKKGQLDVHKTDTNKNGKFDEDIDKEGIWLLDVKGNITKH